MQERKALPWEGGTYMQERKALPPGGDALRVDEEDVGQLLVTVHIQQQVAACRVVQLLSSCQAVDQDGAHPAAGRSLQGGAAA